MNIDAMARKVDVDNRIPLRNYYRIANNLLRQVKYFQILLPLYFVFYKYPAPKLIELGKLFI